MHSFEHLQDSLIILIAAVAVVSLFRRLRASAVLGYLVAGALIGPSGLSLLQDTRAATVLGQLGVVFLLFAIGLELSIDRLVALRRYVFGLGAAQVVGTALLLWRPLRWLGLSNAAAVILASGLALSSTAVVLQMLVQRRELGTSHGRIAFSILLFQDLAVVPLLTLVPLLGRPESSIVSALVDALRQAPVLHGDLLQDTRDIAGHVVIAGFGRVGRTLGLLLDSRFIPYVALDLDPELVAEARRRHLPVFFGDASRADVLKAAGIDRAQMAVSTLDEPEVASRTAQVVRRLRPSVPIIARGRDVAECEALLMAGVTAAVPEIVEGSLQLGAVLLRHLGQSPEGVSQVLEQFRQETYARLSEIAPAPAQPLTGNQASDQA